MTAPLLKTLVLDLLQQGHLDEAAFLQALNETERTAIGKPEFWSAKDHLAHRMFWHQNLIVKVNAILQHQEVSASEESDDQINAKVFEEHKLRPFSDIHAESERIYAQLLKVMEQLSEEDLTTSPRFAPISGEHPLYTVFLGDCYEHDQEHLIQYYLDRHDLPRATQVREQCTNRVIQMEVPAWVKGWFLYHLASFYAQQKQRENAAAPLQEALTLAPDFIKEWLKNDPELVAVHDQST